tara:strand:- start:6 stop:242 length:237 start_codon:yes stop_codon:yes gene_type:complete
MRINATAQPKRSGKIQSMLKSNKESLIQNLDVPYQWWRVVLPERTWLFGINFEKLKIGLDKTYQKDLLVQIKLLEGDF